MCRGSKLSAKELWMNVYISPSAATWLLHSFKKLYSFKWQFQRIQYTSLKNQDKPTVMKQSFWEKKLLPLYEKYNSQSSKKVLLT